MDIDRKAAATSPELISYTFPHKHLLGIEGLSAQEIQLLLDLADSYVEQNRAENKKTDLLRGRTLINLFFEIVLASLDLQISVFLV